MFPECVVAIIQTNRFKKTLLGYNIEKTDKVLLTFVDIGSHENFYRDLKHGKYNAKKHT